MPELPEVEVVRRSLDKKIKQKKVVKVIVKNRNLRFKIPPNFETVLKNQKIISVNRFSKYLILYLSNKKYCLIHLGMSGTIHIVHSDKKNFITNTSFYSNPSLPEKHNHFELIFSKFKIIYNDPRRFGFVQIIDDLNSLKKKFSNLGPEPFHKSFNLEYIFSYFNGKKKCVKNFLLDQNFVSGIGNIYACEILFLSKVIPSKSAGLLKKKECRRIQIHSKKVLMNAIKKGGSTIRNFSNVLGKTGNFQKDFKVYGRESFQCKRSSCHGIIKKNFFAGRSTFFCNICQK